MVRFPFVVKEGKYPVADVFTGLNGLCGFLALTYIIDGRPVMASILLSIAMVLDGLDGAIARRFGSPHHLGHYFDSFSDLISFALAPAALIYFSYYVPGTFTVT